MTTLSNKPSFSLTNDEPTLKGGKSIVSPSDYKSENLRISRPVKFTTPETFYRIYVKYLNEANNKEESLMICSDSGEPMDLWSWGASLPKKDNQPKKNDDNQNVDDLNDNDVKKDYKDNKVNMNLFFLSDSKKSEADPSLIQSQKKMEDLFQRISTDIYNFMVENKAEFLKCAPIDAIKLLKPDAKEYIFTHFITLSEDKDKGNKLNVKLLRGGEKKEFKFFTRFYTKEDEPQNPLDYMYPSYCTVDPVLWFDNIYVSTKTFIPQLKLMEATVNKLESNTSNARLSKNPPVHHKKPSADEL